MTKISTFFIFLLFLLGSVYSQDLRIHGKVIDFYTREPLQGTDVYLSESRCGTVTEKNGNFLFRCKEVPPEDTLTVSYLGYQTYRTLLKDFRNGSIIFLKSKSLDLGDEIVVSADKIDISKQDIPMAKSTVELKEIEDYGSSEISDILKPLPAIRIEGNDLDGRQIQIRGSDANEVNVYLDGILINNVRSDNAADLSIIPVESIETLEVLKGGNSALLGQGAFGGVVNITTRQETEPSIYIKGKMGSFDSQYLIGNITLPLRKRLILSYFGQANSLAPQIEYFPNERFSEKTTNNAITSSKQNHMVNLSYFNRSGQFSGHFIEYLLDYEKPLWQSNYKNYLISTSYKGEILGLKDFDISVDYLYGKDNILRRPQGSSEYNSSYSTNQTNFKFAKKISFKTVDIQLLSEYFHDELLNKSNVKDLNWQSELYHGFIYDNRASVAGVISFQDELKNLPILSWKTYLGLRTDFVASGHRDVSPMLGAQLNYTMEQWTLSPYFNYGKNVKYPSLRENAYVRDLVDFSGDEVSTDKLKPEYNNAAELGISLKYFPKTMYYRNLDFSCALFTRTVYNKLLSRPYDDMISTTQIGSNVTRGIETSLKFNELFKWFTMTAAFIQLDLTNPLLYSYKPKKNLSLHLGYYAPFGFYFTSTFFYEGTSIAWYYDSDNVLQTENITPFSDMDFSTGFKVPFKDAELDFQVSGYNIFDTSGFKYYYLKKRYVQISLALRY
ncbi:MAG: TonB-dependent receptor [Calditrichia bacterium]